MDRSSHHGPLGFRVIGVLKLVSALLCFALGIGLFKLLNKDVGESLTRLVALLRLDPDNRFIHAAVAKMAGVDHKHLMTLGAGTFFYATLYLIEGVGLLLQRHWAGYLTVLATASLIPLEGYEVLKKPDATRIAVLVVNVGIVIYLIYQLRHEQGTKASPPGELATKPSPS